MNTWLWAPRSTATERLEHPSPARRRGLLYEGAIEHRPACSASRRLVALAGEALSCLPSRLDVHERLSNHDLLQHLGSVRRNLGHEPRVVALVTELVLAMGLSEPPSVGSPLAIDSLRLRCITPRMHLLPEASPAFYVHRDTWYANPRSQINLWIALQHIPRSLSFDLYPDSFARAVRNDSEQFDHDTWQRQAGWQNPDRSREASYPRFLGERSSLDHDALSFEINEGDVLIFSAAHLHGTRPIEGNTTRFSLDVRVVHTNDHDQGKGAPDPDNRSTGSTLPSYRLITGENTGTQAW